MPTKDWYISEARKQATDDLEIDDEPKTSEAIDKTGCWVSAWIWISNPETEEETEEES